MHCQRIFPIQIFAITTQNPTIDKGNYFPSRTAIPNAQFTETDTSRAATPQPVIDYLTFFAAHNA
jgi:hypothetical protein